MSVYTTSIFCRMVISITAGFILGKMHLEKYLVNWRMKVQKKRIVHLTFKERVYHSYEETVHIVQRVFPYVILGIGIVLFYSMFCNSNSSQEHCQCFAE